MTQFLVVIDFYVGLAFLLDQFHHLVGPSVFVGPAGDEGAVAHVGLFDGIAQVDAHQLRHQTIKHIAVVLAFVGFEVRRQAEFHQFRVGHIVETKQIGACLFDGRAIGLECVGVGTGQELTAAVAQTLVEVGVKVVAGITIGVDDFSRRLIDYKLSVHAVAVGRFVVGVGEIADGDAFRTMLSAHPV